MEEVAQGLHGADESAHQEPQRNVGDQGAGRSSAEVHRRRETVSDQARRASRAFWAGRVHPDVDISKLPPAKLRTPEQRRAYYRQKHREWRARQALGIKPRVWRESGLDRKGMTHAEYIRELRKLRPVSPEQKRAAYLKYRAKLRADPARLAAYRERQRNRRKRAKMPPAHEVINAALNSWRPPQCED